VEIVSVKGKSLSINYYIVDKIRSQCFLVETKALYDLMSFIFLAIPFISKYNTVEPLNKKKKQHDSQKPVQLL